MMRLIDWLCEYRLVRRGTIISMVFLHLMTVWLYFFR